MGGDELLRSVARFQREMLRKREAQEVKLLAKEPKSLEEKGEHVPIQPWFYQMKLLMLFNCNI